MNRSNSCINDTTLQCSLKCIKAPFREHIPFTDSYHYKKAPISKSPPTLQKRRQRNLTTTASLDYSNHTQKEDYLEEFLDSLEDINNHLEKKLSICTFNIPTCINKVTNKRTRRNLTQPITFNNELHAIIRKNKYVIFLFEF